MSTPPPAPSTPPEVQQLRWTEADAPRSARWRCERPGPPPARVVTADDTLSADAAYRLACEGTALLWRGDFQNARQLLQALARRADRPPRAPRRPPPLAAAAAPEPAGAAFHRHRQAQAQRARVLSMLLIPFDADYGIPLRRAPVVRQACAEVWGAPEVTDTSNASDATEATDAADGVQVANVASLRELLGLISAHEWRKKGVPIPALGPAPDNRIHAHHGVFSPVRGEYVQMVADAPLPAGDGTAFDIGTGSGVLAAVLARRGLRVTATDMDDNALACAGENLARLGLTDQVQLLQADLFPPGRSPLVVCNPPWLPARPGSPIERAVYDEDSRMLLGFLRGLVAHLAPGGEGWLILSDLAERLGLRTRAELLAAIETAGLQVLGRIDRWPVHPKASDTQDPLHAARSGEVTSLWRLGAAA